MSILDQLAILRGTDKSSMVHNYCVKYEKYLPFKRHEHLKILEIGVLRGESLKMWKDYFYKSEILGIDIEKKCKAYEEERIIIEIGSQTNESFLNDISQKYGLFDMILDDGSHINSDIIFSFEKLFPAVKPQGVYVVEDASVSYWADYGGGYLKETSVMEYFKRLADDVSFRGLMNMEHNNVHARNETILTEYSKIKQPTCKTDIESINFLNGIIIITKR